MINIFPTFKQTEARDCGPTCLRMIAKYYGRSIPLEVLCHKARYGKKGVSMLGLSEAAKSIGLKAVGIKLSFEQLINDAPLPAILHYDHYHFVVLIPGSNKKKLIIADPAQGLVELKKKEFIEHWTSKMGNGVAKGTALLIECTPLFPRFHKAKLKN